MAGNRDEFAVRPSAPLDYWRDSPNLLAGRDLQAGGAWFGVTTEGRLAVLTNYREFGKQRREAPSRGTLVRDFLHSTQEAAPFLATLAINAQCYNGFNLLVGSFSNLHYFSNRIMDTATAETTAEGWVLSDGIYGLSNHLLDTPWAKVRRAKAGLLELLNADMISEKSLLGMLMDRTPAATAELPNTGVGLDWERRLSPLFIQADGYHTRASTVLIVEKTGRVRLAERTFDNEANILTERRFSWYCPFI